MPQLTLEWTANIPLRKAPEDLLGRLHELLAGVAGVDIGNCKSRAYRLESYQVAKGDPRGAFVHLDVRLLAGRSDEVNRTLGERCLELLRQTFSPLAAGLQLQLTVEICEIRREAYFKSVTGQLPTD